MDTEEVAVCGINCWICDNFIDNCSCKVYPKLCTVKSCAAEKKLANCLSCARITYCKKRREAIEACIVITPSKEFGRGAIFLLDTQPSEAVKYLFAHSFCGGKSTVISAQHRELFQNQEAFDRLNIETKAVEDLKATDALASAIRQSSERGSCIVFLEGFKQIMEKNDAKKIELFIHELSFIFSTDSTLILSVYGMDKKAKYRIERIINKMNIDKTLSSVSNEIRTKILGHLAERKITFSMLLNEFNLSAPLLSFHLKILKNADIIGQDENGVYFLSKFGKEMWKIIMKVGENLASYKDLGIKIAPREQVKKRWKTAYEKYVRVMFSRGELKTVKLLENLNEGIEIIAGKDVRDAVMYAAFGNYVEAEKIINKEEMERRISEIMFIYLSDYMSIKKCIEWIENLSEYP